MQGSAVVVAGSSHPELARALSRELGVACADRLVERFPDGEQHVEVRTELAGQTVILVQTGRAPIGEHLLELALLSDACHRAGARELCAVLPYFPYTRQDRRTQRGQPLGIRVVSSLLGSLPWSRALTFDLHSAAAEASVAFRLEELSAVPAIAQALRSELPENPVVVGPDLGAAKLARRYARELGLPMALVHKTRLSGSDVVAEHVVGEVRGMTPILVDDIIASGATIRAAGQALLSAGCQAPLVVAATHAVLAGAAAELSTLPIRRLLVSNTLPLATELPFRVDPIDIAPVLAAALRSSLS